MKTIRISALILSVALYLLACSGDESSSDTESSSSNGVSSSDANSSSSVSSSSGTNSSSSTTSSSSSSENSSSSATEASSSSEEEASSSSAVDLGPLCATTNSSSYCLVGGLIAKCLRLGGGTVNTLEDCQGRSGQIVHREDCEKGMIEDGDCEPIDNPYCDPMMYCKTSGLVSANCQRVGAGSMINPSKCATTPVARTDCPANPDNRGDEECDKIDLGGGGLI